jgi:hypothetical protein
MSALPYVKLVEELNGSSYSYVAKFCELIKIQNIQLKLHSDNENKIFEKLRFTQFTSVADPI